MSFRVEEKFLINSNQIFEFKEYLFKKNAIVLFPERNIDSLYFDNYKGEMYNVSVEGITPRKKIRIRQYPNNKNKNLYLETKISSLEGRFKKSNEIQISKFNEFKERGIFDKQYGICKPIVYINYQREYFQLNDVRIVIDQSIKYKHFKKDKIEQDFSSIVEIKTHFNKNRDDLINDFPFQRIRFSKYCNGYNKIYNQNHK